MKGETGAENGLKGNPSFIIERVIRIRYFLNVSPYFLDAPPGDHVDLTCEQIGIA